MLETQHDQEFYLTKAEEHPLLEDVVTGTATMRSKLDSLIERCDRKYSTHRGKLARTKHLMSHLGDYFLALSGLSGQAPATKFDKDWEWVHEVKGEAALYLGAGAVSIGTVFFLWPILPLVLDILAFPVLAGGFIRLKDKLVGAPRDNALQKRRDQILQPIYQLAADVDQDIGKRFILNHFHHARPRFEQTYHTLEPKEREQVDTQLYALLGVGGMRDMDEIQLEDYLKSLISSTEG